MFKGLEADGAAPGGNYFNLNAVCNIGSKCLVITQRPSCILFLRDARFGPSVFLLFFPSNQPFTSHLVIISS